MKIKPESITAEDLTRPAAHRRAKPYVDPNADEQPDWSDVLTENEQLDVKASYEWRNKK